MQRPRTAHACSDAKVSVVEMDSMKFLGVYSVQTFAQTRIKHPVFTNYRCFSAAALKVHVCCDGPQHGHELVCWLCKCSTHFRTYNASSSLLNLI